jgi:threonine/homoserine/homoserine lactone efflux protein
VGDAIGDVLPLGVGVALSPIPVIAVVLLLVGCRARMNGLMFVLGWLFGLAVVGVIVLGVAGPSDGSDDGDPATWVGVLKLVLGALLLLVAVRQWQARPDDGDEVAMPKWMDAIDEFTPAKVLGGGALLSGLNPKNLLLAVAAGAAIAQTGIAGGQQAVAYAVFALIATTGVAIPVVLYFALGDRAPGVLDQLKTWMARHNAAIMATLCLVIGVKLIGDGVAGL